VHYTSEQNNKAQKIFIENKQVHKRQIAMEHIKNENILKHLTELPVIATDGRNSSPNVPEWTG